MKCLRFAALTALCLITLSLTGCKQPEANPEVRDPIYKDLESRAAVHAKAAEEAKAKVTELSATLLKQEPNSLDKKDVVNELAKARQKLLESEQWARYYKIRTARRQVDDRIAYRKAFEADKPWPPAEEWGEYQVNRHLVESPRNWNLRVPKLLNRLPSSKAGESKPAGGHGAPAPKAGGH